MANYPDATPNGEGMTSGKTQGMTSDAIQAHLLSNAIHSFPYRHPIVRRVYLVLFLLFGVIILIPTWTLLYLPRSNRPRPSWTLKRCLRVRWTRLLCGLVARCEIDYLGRDLSLDTDPLTLTSSHPITIPPPPLSILRGHPKRTLDQLHASRGAWVPHFIHRFRREKAGVWGRWNAEHERDRSYGFAPVRAFWFTGEKQSPDQAPAPRNPGDPVMIHFHGGGYICGTAAETDLTSSIPKSIVKHSPIHHVLSVDYRLAPTAPWPLPLLDAISVYHHLVKVDHISESDIVLAGDSAGGHLAMALTRWLRDEGAAVNLKPPRGLVLMSPWADVGFTNAWGSGAAHNKECDTIDDTFGPFACSLLLRALPAETMHTSSYLSPASYLLPSEATGPNSFHHFPPTYIVYGDAERLSNSIQLLWHRLQLSRKDSVIPDRLFVSPDSVHDFIIFPWMAEEASKTYEDLDHWLRELLATDLPDEKLTGRRHSLRITKSPRMGPLDNNTGLIRFMEDMSEEGISMIDTSIEMPKSPDWLTPLTGDLLPESNLDDDEIPWYELDARVEDESDGEDRKDR